MVVNTRHVRIRMYTWTGHGRLKGDNTVSSGAEVDTFPVSSLTPMAYQQEEVVGYSCEFVEDVPKEIQTDCSICLHVLKDPQMVGCCCYSFCNSCIQRVLHKFNKCPLCNQRNPMTVADKQLARTLKQKKVKCTHDKEGCKWTGALSMLDDHLDTVRRTDGCVFKKMRCRHCNTTLQKNQMKDHESKCLKKPTVCEFCTRFQCLRHELAQHWESCSLYPILCPKGCGATVTRLSISQHFDVSCPLTIVECEFASHGCEIKVRRRDMKDHMTQSMEDHLAMLTKKCSKLEIAYEVEKRMNRQLAVQLEDAQVDRENIEGERDEAEREVTVLKTLCNLRANDGFDNPNDQVIVYNLPPAATEHMVKSLFGQHGPIYRVMFYPCSSIALIEYNSNDSVNRLFRKYNSTGIRLHGYQLKCMSLEY